MENNNQSAGIDDNNYGGKAIVTFSADSTILKEGVVYNDMYKIIQGKAVLYVGYATEKEVILGIIGPGSCFGEMGLLLQAPAIYTVVAFTDVYAIKVTPDRMGQFIENNQNTVLQIMQNMARTMTVMQHEIVALEDELSSYTHEATDEKHAQKEMVRSYYNPKQSVGMSGKMHFIGRRN